MVYCNHRKRTSHDPPIILALVSRLFAFLSIAFSIQLIYEVFIITLSSFAPFAYASTFEFRAFVSESVRYYVDIE